MKKAKDQPESEPAELASFVGERIRKIRKEEGLSLELFALRCDMNAAYIGHIERGVQNPSLNTLERIKLYQKINGCSGTIHLKCHRCNTLLRIDLSFRRKK